MTWRWLSRIGSETRRTGLSERAFELAYGRSPSEAGARACRATCQGDDCLPSRARACAAQGARGVGTGAAEPAIGGDVSLHRRPASVEYEENLHASQVGPATRALADLALVLFNSNEFAYVY